MLARQMGINGPLCVCVFVGGQRDQVVTIAWLLSMSYVASAPGLIIALLAQLLSIPAYRSIVSVTLPWDSHDSFQEIIGQIWHSCGTIMAASGQLDGIFGVVPPLSSFYHFARRSSPSREGRV